MLTDIHFPLNVPAALKREPFWGKTNITIGTATAELLQAQVIVPLPSLVPRVVFNNIHFPLNLPPTFMKKAGLGKNGHHHRDRDGRIALGPGDRGI